MNPKPRPNHRQYLETLRNMTEAQRLQKAFELGEFSRQLFKAGLRERFPEKTEEEIIAVIVEAAYKSSREKARISQRIHGQR